MSKVRETDFRPTFSSHGWLIFSADLPTWRYLCSSFMCSCSQTKLAICSCGRVKHHSHGNLQVKSAEVDVYGSVATCFKFDNSISWLGLKSVSPRKPSQLLAFYDVQNFPQGFPRKLSNASRIRKSYSGRSRAHLATSTEWVSSPTNKSCLCKSISPFTMGLYGSPYDYVIHVGLIATSRDH